MSDDQGSATAWLMILVSIFIIMLLWIILTEPIIRISDTFENRMPNENATATFNFLHMVWYAWPIILVVFLIIYGIMQSTKREYDTGMY